jgi:Sulfotransferase family
MSETIAVKSMAIEKIDFGNRAPADQLLLFLHIPKAGGTTLNGIINQQYPKAKAFHLNGINNRSQLAQLSLRQRQSLKIIRGHFAFGLHRFLSAPSTYFTFLRDPVKRVISHYQYVRRSPSVPGHAEALTMSLADYALAKKGNLQTRMLYGLTEQHSSCESDMIAIAKQHLDTYFPVVGLVECFDASLILLQLTFNWKTPVYIQQNVTVQAKQSSLSIEDHKISSETLALIQEKNTMDLALYQYAQDRFEQHIKHQGQRFDQLLVTQQRINRLYQPLGKTYNWARTQILRGNHG